MAYLFWAYALVWIVLFFYLYGLARRGRALERQVAELLARSRGSARAEPPAGGPRRGAGRS
jgi:CcmD family protein